MNDSTPLKIWENLQASEVFEALPGVLDRWHWVVVVTAFLLLSFGHVSGLQRAGNDSKSIIHHWYRTLLLLALMLTSPFAATTGLEAMANWERHDTFGSLAGVSRRCVTISCALPPLEQVLVRPTASTGTLADYADMTQFADDIWESSAEIDTRPSTLDESGQTLASRQIGTAAAVGIKALSIFVTYVVCEASLLGAAALGWLAEVIRYALLVVVAAALPVIIAAFRVRSLSSKARGALLAGLWILVCPCTWTLGHLGTPKVFNNYVHFLSLRTDQQAASSNSLEWNQIDSEKAGPALAFEVQGASVSYGWMCSVAVSAMLLLVWVGLVTLGGPWLLYVLMVSGGALGKSTDPKRVSKNQIQSIGGPSPNYLTDMTKVLSSINDRNRGVSSVLESSYIQPVITPGSEENYGFNDTLGNQGTVTYRVRPNSEGGE